jgi:hypothetical protein
MNANDYNNLITKARAFSQSKIEAAKAIYGIGSWQHFNIDLTTAKIRFSNDNDSIQVESDIQAVGSWAPESQTWLWSLDNESIPLIASKQLNKVRTFGEKEKIDTISGSFEPCDEGEAWSMACIACQLLDAECIYRVNHPKNHLFLLLFKICKI